MDELDGLGYRVTSPSPRGIHVESKRGPVPGPGAPGPRQAVDVNKVFKIFISPLTAMQVPCCRMGSRSIRSIGCSILH